MRRTARNTGFAITALLLTACSGKDIPDVVLQDGNVAIAVHTQVVADETLMTGRSGRLLFWGDDDFHDKWMEKKPVEPRYTVLLDKEINHYTYDRQIYYETPYTYLADFNKIHATGYAPDYALSPVGRSYAELEVDDQYRDGSVDLLTCDGSFAHSASMNPDNTFLEREKELQFRHLTAKLTFLGERADEMVGLVGVRNIRITLHDPADEGGKLVVPAKLELYTDNIEIKDEEVEADTGIDKEDDYSTYIVSETSPYPYATRKLEYTPIIPSNETVTLGTCYVLSDGLGYGTQDGQFDPIKGEWTGTSLTGTPKLGITIEAQLYDASGQGSSSAFVEETWVVDNITTWDSNTGDKFLPGYEYKVTIRFNRTGIALRAEAVPWNSEELHEYPIHPENPGAGTDDSQN